jgi:hypothetical protein
MPPSCKERTYACERAHVRMCFCVGFVGQNRIYTHTVYDRMYGDSPAENAVCTPYIRVNVW